MQFRKINDTEKAEANTLLLTHLPECYRTHFVHQKKKELKI